MTSLFGLKGTETQKADTKADTPIILLRQVVPRKSPRRAEEPEGSYDESKRKQKTTLGVWPCLASCFCSHQGLGNAALVAAARQRFWLADVFNL